LQELGYKDFDITGWFGLLFPANTPRDYIGHIYRESKEALAEPEVARVINAAGMYAIGSSPAEFTAFLQQDYAYQGKLMTELGLKTK
jgi:tripartite-type tricarboxylate transporter receptor subunit TctC